MDASHGDLAPLLRLWRDRLSPVDVGLRAGDGRRSPGLRREELSALAGVSVDYLVRLEQGRARRPSEQVASSLARALQLTDEERDHLFIVAGLLPPSPRDVPTHIPPGVQRMIARMSELPVLVFTASWTLISWTPIMATLIGDPNLSDDGSWNLLRRHFSIDSRAVEDARIVSSRGDEAFSHSLVADLRRVHGRYPDDRGLTALIDELQRSSERFRELWMSGAVGEHQSERKTIRHPLVEEFELDCDVFSVAGSDLRIVVYTVAAGSDAAEKLDFLRVSAVSARTSAGLS
ncbi:helix-turn-helix transcriptional regulator [Microbacterium sp. MPKO10]|uniref:helix-turn-helix transcriptional regulator n=1 Tax=Microbacterium sp. MPKO10 TaxID=2989818 RepID=UPI002236BFF6|nr:helix-turn-helix transcriptional regulator [Microbacterium sp. MPKO10]MCW4459997.1 helix-turn-helix transcriptional regulator [Microbacterium sp. MPKO10]